MFEKFVREPILGRDKSLGTMFVNNIRAASPFDAFEYLASGRAR